MKTYENHQNLYKSHKMQPALAAFDAFEELCRLLLWLPSPFALPRLMGEFV